MQLKIFAICIVMLLLTIAASRVDASIFVNAASIKAKLNQDRSFLIDVRSKKQYNQIRIPGSLNFPLYTIKTKTFLKTKPLVLMNNGFATSLLEKECERLNKMGFRASVLLGGLNAWNQNKGPLEGDYTGTRAFNQISPAELQMELGKQEFSIIDVSDGRNVKQRFPNAIKLSMADFRNPTNQRLKQKLSVHANRLIVLMNQDGQGYGAIEKAISNLNIGPVYFLDGGLNGYHAFLNRLALAQKPRAERMKTIGNCNQCGKKKKSKDMK